MADKQVVTISKISEKTKGILANNQWYSTKGKVQEYVTKDKEGSKVELSFDDEGNIVFLKVLEKGNNESQNQPQKPQQNNYQKDDSRIMRHGLLNTAIELYKLNREEGEGAKKITAEEVINMAEYLKEYVENGTVPKLQDNISEEDVE